jgi:acetylornithine deacetylase/succinyl-diaminopimelate desuccinylase-like protein
MTQRGADALAAARRYEADVVRFLRDMISIPAESLQEAERAERIYKEYERLGFDDVFFDRLGNVIARVGGGPLKILMDGHFDCVGVGDPTAWTHDPFEGKYEAGKIWGRGAVDELPAVACMAYAARLLSERGVPDSVTVYLSATVMEEDCDGYCLLHLIEKEGIRPDVVVLGEPTDLNVYRGQRGRVEATIATRGVSAHAAHPERGVNALYKIAPIIQDIAALNDRLPDDAFLGKGTVVVSSIECTTPSLNAVPEYEATSWRGEEAKQEKYYPTWVLPEEHALVRGVADAVSAVLGKPPAISRWSFSTNGVASMGRHGIPTVGFAPGLEELAHTTEEWVAVEDLVRAIAVYSLIPDSLVAHKDELLAAGDHRVRSG